VPPWLRATALVLAAIVAAVVATRVALTSRTRARAVLWSLALTGPAAALGALRACEQSRIGDLRLMAVPVAALAAVCAGAALLAALGALRAR
jgi:hypothetical protein